MNNDITAQFDTDIHQSFMLSLCSQYHRKNFSITCADMGETIYEWMDAQIKNLSSARLAKFLRWAEYEGMLGSQFVIAVKSELMARGHYEASLQWRF